MTNAPIPSDSAQPNPGRLDPSKGVRPGSGAVERASTDAASPSFRVLLERLQSKAQALEEASQSVEDPENLAQAVEDARDSLEEAGDLGQRLLEAWREARTQGRLPESSSPERDAS